MSKPLFSIIMPVYNLERYVRDAVDSVLDQTVGNFECICVDDGSTDDSGAILDEYAYKDSRIKVLHQENGGEGAARNAGLEVAQGEWLAFLDGDDVWHPQTLEICMNGLLRYPKADAVRFDFSEFRDGELETWYRDNGGAAEWSYVDCTGKLTNDCFMSGMWAHLYRRQKVGDVRFTDLCVGADRVYFAECLNRLDYIAACNGCVLYGYRQREGSAINSVLTLRKAKSDLRWRFLVIKVWQNQHREFSSSFMRWMSILVTESLAARFRDLNGGDRRAFWQYWLENMKTIRRNEIFHGWWGLTTSICCLSRLYLLFRLCFGLPHKLKLMGFHR